MFLSPEQLSFPSSLAVTTPRISTLLEKGSGTINEDVILRGKNGTYGVFDGATSLVQTRYTDGLTGGLLAAQICAQTFGELSEDLSACACQANARIKAEAVATGVNFKCKEELWSTSAAVIRLEDDSFSWCQLGDSHILAVYWDNSYRLLSVDPGHDRETLLAWKRQAATAPGTIMEVMAEEILHVRRGMNINYGVLNGEPEALHFLHCGKESLQGVRNIVIFSDGLLPPRENPAAPIDLDAIVSLYMQGGLTGIREYVRSTELTDIGCRIYPRFKTHDDISAVALSFST